MNSAKKETCFDTIKLIILFFYLNYLKDHNANFHSGIFNNFLK